MAPLRALSLFLLGLVFSGGGGAADFSPATNHAALAGSFALPAAGSWKVSAPDRGELQLTLNFLNEWESLGFDAAGNCARTECIRVDAESYRLGVQYRRGFAPGWEWTLEIPLIVQANGFLDPLIEHWHGWFDLPNNGRQRYPHHQYEFQYVRNNEVVLDTHEPGAGVGDLRLGLGRSIGRSTIRAQFKLPTGSAEQMREGNLGGAVWLDAALIESSTWRSYVSAGISINSRGNVLPEQQNQVVPFGAVGLAASVTDSFQLQTQLYFHGRLYKDSELRNVYRYGAVLGFGGRYRFSPNWSLDVGMLEDADVNVSPDFDFQLALNWNG